MMPITSTTPYGYGMNNDVPSAMSPQPQQTLPSLYPSMMTPQLNPQQPTGFPQPRYARGGHVGHMANQVRHAGQRGDNILAHINPEEAHELMVRHGGDINPHTGLPQFGLFDYLRNGVNQLGDYAENTGRDLWRNYGHGLVDQGLDYLDTGIGGALPTLGTAGGAMIGAPIGAPIMGGTIGGGLGERLANRYKESGGMKGYMMPRLESYFGPGAENPPAMHPIAASVVNSLQQRLPGAMQETGEYIRSRVPGMMSQARDYFNRMNQPSAAPAMAAPAPAPMPNLGHSPAPMHVPNQAPAAPQFAPRSYMTQNVSPEQMQQFNQQVQNRVPRSAMMGHANPYQFARGGHVNSLRGAASYLKSRGTEGDDILAHLSPEEAQELSQEHGYSINEETGLPEFGLFRKLEQKLRKPVKVALPFIGGALGNMVGGPIGGTIGGAIGGALGDKKHALKGAGMGALKGAAVSALLPVLGNAMGVNSTGTGGKMLGMGHKGLLSSLGIGAGSKSSSYSGGDETSTGGGGQGGLMNSLGGPLNLALLGTAVGGIAMDKRKSKEKLPPGMESGPAPGALQPPPIQWRPDQQPRTLKQKQRKMKKFDPETFNYGGPEVSFYEDFDPEPEYLAKGGYLDGGESGQEDNIEARLSPGEYVMDATSVSLLGDGNNKAGAMLLDKMRKQIRKHKGVTKFLPPKSKPLSTYLKEARR